MNATVAPSATITDEELLFLEEITNSVYLYVRKSNTFRIMVNPFLADTYIPEYDVYMDAIIANERNCNRFQEWSSRLLEEKWIPSKSEIDDAIALVDEASEHLKIFHAEHFRFASDRDTRWIGSTILVSAESQLKNLKNTLTKNQMERNSAHGK